VVGNGTGITEMADQTEPSRGGGGDGTDATHTSDAEPHTTPSAQARLAEAALSFLRGPLPTLGAPEGSPERAAQEAEHKAWADMQAAAADRRKGKFKANRYIKKFMQFGDVAELTAELDMTNPGAMLGRYLATAQKDALAMPSTDANEPSGAGAEGRSASAEADTSVPAVAGRRLTAAQKKRLKKSRKEARKQQQVSGQGRGAEEMANEATGEPEPEPEGQPATQAAVSAEQGEEGADQNSDQKREELRERLRAQAGQRQRKAPKSEGEKLDFDTMHMDADGAGHMSSELAREAEAKFAAKPEVHHAEKVKRYRQQANYGATKFIKP
jgi:hypothetical protein